MLTGQRSEAPAAALPQPPGEQPRDGVLPNTLPFPAHRSPAAFQTPSQCPEEACGKRPGTHLCHVLHHAGRPGTDGPLCGPTYHPGAPGLFTEPTPPSPLFLVARRGASRQHPHLRAHPKSLSKRCDMGERMEGRADRWTGRQSRATGKKPLLPRASAPSRRRPPSGGPSTFSGTHGREAHADQQERERERGVKRSNPRTSVSALPSLPPGERCREKGTDPRGWRAAGLGQLFLKGQLQ